MKRFDWTPITYLLLPALLVSSLSSFMIAFSGYAIENGTDPDFPRVLGQLGMLTDIAVLVCVLVFAKHYLERKRLLRDAERERDFASLVAHQTRAEFTELGWMADTVADPAGTAESRTAAADDMRRVIQHGSRTVKALLRISRLERGAADLEAAAVPVAAIVDDAVTPLREQAAKKRITIAVETDPQSVALVDRELVAEAVRNVIDNALKYGPEGSSVEVRGELGHAAGTVAISVRDHGPGIDEDSRRQVFQKTAIHGDTAAEGAGLGLYITKMLVELHGGSVRFETSPQGTTFRLTLPAAKK